LFAERITDLFRVIMIRSYLSPDEDRAALHHLKDSSDKTRRHISSSWMMISDLCDVLARYLEAEDFRVSVGAHRVRGAKAGIEGSYELIVWTVMLPDKKGFDVLPRNTAAG